VNQTPRTLNRILITLLGLLLMLAGGTALALALVPALAGWWHAATAQAGANLQTVLDATTLPGQRDSWLWIVASLLLLLVVLLMIAWVAQQGKGRTGTIAADFDGDGAPGAVQLSSGVAEQALRAALLENESILNATVTAYDYDGGGALRIRVVPRLGRSPQAVADEVSDLVEALDLALGMSFPVVIHLVAGARSRLVRADRVR
jgi:hypothetical protein